MDKRLCPHLKATGWKVIPLGTWKQSKQKKRCCIMPINVNIGRLARRPHNLPFSCFSMRTTTSSCWITSNAMLRSHLCLWGHPLAFLTSWCDSFKDFLSLYPRNTLQCVFSWTASWECALIGVWNFSTSCLGVFDGNASRKFMHQGAQAKGNLSALHHSSQVWKNQGH